MHVPTASTVMIEPLTLQTVGSFEARTTAKPEEAVGDTVNGATPRVTFEMGPKMTVWGDRAAVLAGSWYSKAPASQAAPVTPGRGSPRSSVATTQSPAGTTS
jgi:hypothetical protein